MIKILIRIAVTVLLIILLAVGSLFIMSVLATRPDNLGVRNGRLADCPNTPNCVSTQAKNDQHAIDPVPFKTGSAQALADIKAVVQAMPRTTIIKEEENYLHVEFRSLIFRFVDDVEFYLDAHAEHIHFRSASRTGRSDLGVNRRRMEKFREQMAERGYARSK